MHYREFLKETKFVQKHHGGFVVFYRHGVDIDHGMEYFTDMTELRTIYKSYRLGNKLSVDERIVISMDDYMWEEAPKKKGNSYLIYSSRDDIVKRK